MKERDKRERNRDVQENVLKKNCCWDTHVWETHSLNSLQGWESKKTTFGSPLSVVVPLGDSLPETTPVEVGCGGWGAHSTLFTRLKVTTMFKSKPSSPGVFVAVSPPCAILTNKNFWGSFSYCHISTSYWQKVCFCKYIDRLSNDAKKSLSSWL